MEIEELKLAVEAALSTVEHNNKDIDACFLADTNAVTDQVKRLLEVKNAIITEQLQTIKVLITCIYKLQNQCDEFKLNFDQMKHFFDVERSKNTGKFNKN
jgi:hypothetical protein